jgi:geranylgeranyl diphosphate synthase type I
MTPTDVFNRFRGSILKELQSIVDGNRLAIYDIIRYHLGWVDRQGHLTDSGGKLVRPTLLLLACEALGCDWVAALPAAASVELVHNFTLIHDDIEDGDQQRHNRATVWWLFGKPQAINAGDALHSMASLALLRLEPNDVAPHKRHRAADILDKTCLELCEGQYLDIYYESQSEINTDSYLEMIDLKTASLFSASLEIGALIATDDETKLKRFRNFGRKIGLAYQMLDDVLGIWGNEFASDILKKKKTIPVVYALQHAKGRERAELVGIYSKETVDQEDADKVIKILNRLDAEGYSRSMANKYYNEALQELNVIDLDPSAMDELKETTAFLMSRTY